LEPSFFISGIENFLQKLKQRNILIAFIIAAVMAFLVFPFFFNTPVFPLPAHGLNSDGLDPSWKLLLNKTNIDHAVWGKDLTITYGPFGYLSTRVGWGINKYTLLLFDLFVLFNFFFIFYTVYLRSGSKISVCLLYLGLLICLPVHFGSGTSLVLLAFLVFWILRSLGKIKPLDYSMQLCLIIILFFVKFNTGLATFIFFFAGLIYNYFFSKKSKVLFLILGLAPFILTFIFCKILNVGLAPYISGGLNMVSGYNGIMYLDQDFHWEFIFSGFIIFLIVLIFVVEFYFEKENRAKSLVKSFILFSSLYILYKQSFVRNDIQHVMDFYKYILLFVLCSYHFSSKPNDRIATTVLFLVIGIASVFSIKTKSINFFNLKARINKSSYLNDFTHFEEKSALHLFPGNNPIPQRIHERIGNKTVDVYPWNIQLLIENKLNYKQRPVPQSYTAYTAYLENLNFEFYNSAKAPQFVIYEFDAIDNRYPLFDEPKLNLSLLKNYKLVDTFSLGNRPLLVFEKTNTNKINFQRIKEFNMKIGDSLVPQPETYYEVFITNSFKGKCYSFLKHGPKLGLLIKTKNGQQREYKTSIELLKTGIFSTKFFASTNDFENFINADSLNTSNEIEFYSFNTADPGMFNKEIKIIEYKILH